MVKIQNLSSLFVPRDERLRFLLNNKRSVWSIHKKKKNSTDGWEGGQLRKPWVERIRPLPPLILSSIDFFVCGHPLYESMCSTISRLARPEPCSHDYFEDPIMCSRSEMRGVLATIQLNDTVLRSPYIRYEDPPTVPTLKKYEKVTKIRWIWTEDENEMTDRITE